MSTKKAMTLILGDAEMKTLEELSEKKEMTKAAVIRRAIRLYYLMDLKMGEGSKFLIEAADGKGKSELMVL